MAGFDPSIDPNEDPYFAWARAQQLAELQAQQQPPLVDPLAQPTLDAAGRKGGSTSGPARTQHVGPALLQGSQLAAAAAPDLDASTDTADARGDMTPEEIHEQGAPPVQPDAISGAAPAADVASMVQLGQAPPDAAVQAPAPSDAGYYDWARQQAAGQPLPSMADRTMRDSAQAEIDAIGKMTPEEYIRWQGERAGHLRDMQTQQQADIDAENQRRAQQAFEAQQAAIAQAHAESADMMRRADELANTKIVPKKAGLADVVGILLGGMFSGGGPNMALAQFNRKVDADMQAQHENISNGYRGLEMKRGAIADELARHGDLYRAQETYRIASYQTAINHLQTELQQYDPAGTTAMTIRNGIDQFALAKQKAAADATKQLVEDNLKRAQTAQAAATALKTQQETAGLKAKQAGGPAKPEDVVTPDELAYIAKQTGIQFAPGATRKEVNARLGTFKNVGEASKGATEATGTLNAGLIRNPVTKQPLNDPNDPAQRLIYPVAQASEINDQIGATQNAIDSLSAARRALNADPSSFDRKEWARIQSNIAQSFPALAKVYGENYSARTEEALKDLLHLDYDSYINRAKDKGTGMATIDTTIDSLIQHGNTTIGTKLGYDADKKPLFLDTSRPPESPKTPTDTSVETIASTTSDKWTDEDHAIQKMRAAGAAKDTPRQIYADYGIDVKDPAFKADFERVQSTNVPISKLRAIDALKEQALATSPAERSKAVAALAEIAKDDGPAGNEATKTLAEIAKKLAPLVNQAEDQVFGADGGAK